MGTLLTHQIPPKLLACPQEMQTTKQNECNNYYMKYQLKHDSTLTTSINLKDP